MKKINIQKDLDSRAGIARGEPSAIPVRDIEIPAPALPPVQRTEPEPGKEDTQNAQSQEDPAAAADQSAVKAEKSQKRGRTPKGDPEEV